MPPPLHLSDIRCKCFPYRRCHGKQKYAMKECRRVFRLPSVTPCEVSKLLHKSPPKSSSMDTIPTSLLLECHESFSVIIAHLANLSFAEGKFPTRFKTASVTPLLKNPSLDKSLSSSYRPISNLNFISKILERLFLHRIQSHILASPNFNQHQSAYRPGHSTETTLVQLLDSI